MNNAPTSTPTPATPLNGIAALPHLGIIRVQGADAAKFLHNQLTQDFSLLGSSEARLAAFCSAKGRMQASFIGFKRSADDILLICSRDLLEQTRKRLAMFVLRSKATLSDASADFALYGIAGEALASLGAVPSRPWGLVQQGEASVIGLYPAIGVARALWVAPATVAPPTAGLMPLQLWLWSEVQSGIATLSLPVFEAFVPQMLNYESVGGVNFKKGCYPGQEVVARSQFRGTLKRRTFLAHSAIPLVAGQDIFNSTDPSQPAGRVVQAAAAPQGGWDALVSLQLAALESGSLYSGNSPVDGALGLLPLPYALMEDI